MIVPPVARDVKLMSIGFFLDENSPVMWRGPMLHRALEQFLSDVHWGELDELLVDMPPGTGDVSISLGQLLPRAEAVIVTTPQPLAQEVAARAALMAQKTNMRVIGVVENMTSDVFGSGGGAELASAVGRRRCSARCRSTLRLREAGDRGEPLVWADPDAEAAQAIVAVAEAIEAAKQTFKPLPVLVLNADEVLPRIRALGFSDADAQTLADHFLDAERRGKHGHGFSRVEWLATLDGLDPTARPERVVAEPGYERWHGRGALGYLTLAAICAGAARRRRPSGRASSSPRRCFPTGALGYWVRRLADGGLCAALTATSPAAARAPGRGRAARRDDTARDRHPELGRQAASSPTSRWARSPTAT